MCLELNVQYQNLIQSHLSTKFVHKHTVNMGILNVQRFLIIFSFDGENKYLRNTNTFF